MSNPLPIRDERLHGLDWLRAGAALAVVALHAGIAYTVAPFPGLAWPVHDARPSPVVDALTWWIDAWIMPVFFMMSGFLAAQLFQRLGPAEFVKHRARRLLGPLAFACVVILPLDLYVWLVGWVIEERIPLKKLRSLKLGDAGRDLWGIAHLWFLEYLLVFCVAAWVLNWSWERIASWHVRRWLPAKRWVVVPALAGLGALALWWDPQLVIGFRHAWHPLPANLLYYAPCFAAGWWWQTQGIAASGGSRWTFAALLASLFVIAGILPLIHEYALQGQTGLPRLGLASGFCACGWLTAAALLRLSLRPCARPPRLVAYLAQASFWVYLFHHPAVGLAQVALHGSRLPAETKFVLVWSSATVLSLLTYEVGVRRTWVGVVLNGRRDGTTSKPAVATGPDIQRRAA